MKYILLMFAGLLFLRGCFKAVTASNSFQEIGAAITFTSAFVCFGACAICHAIERAAERDAKEARKKPDV